MQEFYCNCSKRSTDLTIINYKVAKLFFNFVKIHKDWCVCQYRRSPGISTYAVETMGEEYALKIDMCLLVTNKNRTRPSNNDVTSAEIITS